MRRALDGSPPITTKHGQAGFGYFGKHAGYDYGVQRWAVRAPEAGTISAVYTGRQNVDGGNIVELVGKYTHRFLHLDTINVKVGDKVTEGQQLGISGNSGNVGFHLHHDVRKNGTGWMDSYNNYVDWEALIKGGEMVNDTDNEFGRWNKLFTQIRGRAATRAEFRQAAAGKTWLRAMEILSDDVEADKAQKAQVVGQLALKDDWQGQIGTLKGKVAELGKSLALYQAQAGDVEANVVGKALLALLKTLGYKKG